MRLNPRQIRELSTFQVLGKDLKFNNLFHVSCPFFQEFAYGPECLNVIPEWFTTSHSDLGYLIAPVSGHNIDWDFIEVS